MCYAWVAYAALAAASVNQAEQQRKGASTASRDTREASDRAEAERGRVEAEAAQNANQRLVATQQRRRQSLLSTGAPTAQAEATSASTLSKSSADTGIGTEPTTRSSVGRQSSLMGRGAPSATFFG